MPIIDPAYRTLGSVYSLVIDPDTLMFVPMTQPLLQAETLTIAGTIAATQSGTWVVAGPGALIPASGVASASGNTTLVTPTAGMRLRVYYVAYNPAAAVEAGFRFGASGTLFPRNTLTVAGSVIAKDFGNLSYWQGAINESLLLNLSSAVSTVWNVLYVEVASIADTGTGRLGVTIGTDFSSANYSINATVERSVTALTATGVEDVSIRNASPTAGVFEIESYDHTAILFAAQDPAQYYWQCFGDQ